MEMEDAMKLEHLTIRKDYYLDGKYAGELKFAGVYGAVEVKLNADLSKQILEVVAANMVQQTKDLAANLTANILAGDPPPALEAPE